MTDIIIQENYLKKQNETIDELSSKMTNSLNIETILEKQGQEKSFLLSVDPSVNQDKTSFEKYIELPLPFHQNKEFDKKNAKRDSNNQNSSILTKPNYQQHNQINSSRIITPYNNKQYHHQVYENQQPDIIRNSQADQRFRVQQQNKFKIDKLQGIITPAASVSDMNEDNQKINNQISRMPNDNLNQINPLNPINDFSKFSYIPEKQQDYQRLISAHSNRNQIYQNQINQPCFNRIGSRDGMLPKQYFNNYNSQLSIDPVQDRFSQIFLTHPDINRKEHQIPPLRQHPEISLEQILIYKNHDYDHLKNQLKQKKALYELRQKTRFQLIALIQKENNNLIEQKQRCVELVQCIQDCIDFMAVINEIQSQLYVIREEQEEIKKKIQLSQEISTQLKPQPMQDETIKVEYDANEKCDKSQTVISIENIQNNQDQNTTQDDKAVDKSINLEINDNQLKIKENKENVIQGGQIHNEFQQEQILIKKEGDSFDHTMPNNQFNLNQQENQLQNKSKFSQQQQQEDVIQQKYLDKLIHPFNGVSHPALQVISQPSTQISRPPPYSFEVQDFPYQNYQHLQLANSNPLPLFPSKPQFNQNNGQIQTIVKEEHIPVAAPALLSSKQLEDRDDENESMSEEDNNKKNINIICDKYFPYGQNQVYQAFDNQVKIEQGNIENYIEYQQMGSQYLYAQNNQVGQNNSSQSKEYNNQMQIGMKKRLDKKPKKHSDTKDLIRFRKGQEKDVKQLTYLQLSEQELQKKLQFHNQLKIFMLQSSKYIKEQIIEKIKLNDVKEEQEIYEQHIRYLDAFKNRFTKSDLSHFLKIINEISYEEIIDNMRELDQKLKLIKQRKITYIITIIKSFTNEDQFKQIFPEENEEIFEQNSTYLSEHLLQNRQKIQQINEYIGKINYFNKMNRTYLQNYCLYQLSITACKKKASKLDQLYVKNYVLQMLNNPSHIE